jgi:predicted  nucleic acid-binding Zn-ribbon protein
MAKTKASASVEEKLRSLYDLQLIDSKIDEIRSTRGELPKEVENLEDEVQDIENRINSLNEEKEQLDSEISKKKIAIQESEAQIKKFKSQLDNVKNNREFEALSKEIEFQNLEIELANKRIKEYQAKIANKDEILEMAQEKLNERKEDLKLKKGELDNIIVANEKTEKNLLKLSEDFAGKIEERLLTAYKRIRGNAKNGLAVVPVIDGATYGSFFQVPPQRELDIRARKKIIVSEHCGRILVDNDLATEEQEKMEKVFSKS